MASGVSVCRCSSRWACGPMASASSWMCGSPAMKVPRPGVTSFAASSTRHVGLPRLAVIDGSPGLAAALREQWPALAIQRCTAHKLRNLEAKAPAPARRARGRLPAHDLCETRTAVDQARTRFTQEVATALSSGRGVPGRSGRRPLHLSALPKAQWKALRTTNALERINGEFRRRTKTQASLPSQDAVLLLLFGLLRSGQVKLRKIDGWQEMERAKQAA